MVVVELCSQQRVVAEEKQWSPNRLAITSWQISQRWSKLNRSDASTGVHSQASSTWDLLGIVSTCY